MRPPLRAFLFDLGGTLIYPLAPWPPIWEEADRALVRALRRCGAIADEETFLPRWKERRRGYYAQRKEDAREHTYRYILQELLPGLSPVALEEALAAFFSITQPNWHADEQALPVLRGLQERGFRLGLLSNAAEDGDVQQLVDRMGFRPFFDFILTSAACGYRKPHPLLFQLALSHWKFSPSEVAMVGDLLAVDILGAKQVGLFAVWVRRHAPPEEEPIPAQPDWTLEHLGDLLERVTE